MTGTGNTAVGYVGFTQGKFHLIECLPDDPKVNIFAGNQDALPGPPSPGQFAMCLPFGDVLRVLAPEPSTKDERLAGKARKAICAALDALSDAEPKLSNSQCNIALCEMLFESVCEVAPETWKEVGRRELPPSA